jgi:hypothetical protein
MASSKTSMAAMEPNATTVRIPTLSKERACERGIIIHE